MDGSLAAVDGRLAATGRHRDAKRVLRRRPLLLGLVYGVILILVAITATAQAIVATSGTD